MGTDIQKHSAKLKDVGTPEGMSNTEDPGRRSEVSSAGELTAIPSWLQTAGREAHLCWLEDEEGRAGQMPCTRGGGGGALDLDQHKAV